MTTMANERWQYQVVDMKAGIWTMTLKAEQIQEQLTKLGQLGWELVQVLQVSTTVRLFLKRRA
jgi:hypothetical protein